MPSISSPSEIKLEYGSLGVRIKNLTQKDWVKACKKLELVVPDGAGAGSHAAVYKIKATSPYKSEDLVLTIVKKPYAQIQVNMFKKLVLNGIQSGKYKEKDVWEALGVKVPKKLTLE